MKTSAGVWRGSVLNGMWRKSGDEGFTASGPGAMLPRSPRRPNRRGEESRKRSDAREAEGAPLLREYRVKSSIEGSNPSHSATGFAMQKLDEPVHSTAQFRFCAPVAQLDRAPGYELGGREFESLRARHLSKRKRQRCKSLAFSFARLGLPTRAITRYAHGCMCSRHLEEGNEMVGVAGFEPTTTCPPDKCATRLRYTPTLEFP